MMIWCFTSLSTSFKLYLDEEIVANCFTVIKTIMADSVDPGEVISSGYPGPPFALFVYVEVLWPTQPIRVMSSFVTLPNFLHGQA